MWIELIYLPSKLRYSMKFELVCANLGHYFYVSPSFMVALLDSSWNNFPDINRALLRCRWEQPSVQKPGPKCKILKHNCNLIVILSNDNYFRSWTDTYNNSSPLTNSAAFRHLRECLSEISPHDAIKRWAQIISDRSFWKVNTHLMTELCEFVFEKMVRVCGHVLT